jgi:hypothetical protein
VAVKILTCDETVVTNAYPGFMVSVQLASDSIYSNGMLFYVASDGLDSTLIKLSKSIPDAVVNVHCMARIKARYRNGAREVVRDMETFYSNLTAEQIAACQYKCSSTHKMI